MFRFCCFSRRLVAVLLCMVGFVSMYAKPADSLIVRRDRGFECMRKGLYSEAYVAFKYYFDHLQESDKYTLEYLDVHKAYLVATSKISGVLERCFEEAETAQRKGQTRLADSLYRRYIAMSVTPESQQTYPYTVVLTRLALTQIRQGRLKDCIRELERVVAIRRDNPTMHASNVAETLNYIASAYHQLGDYDKAITTCSEALDIYRKYFGAKHEYCGNTLNNLASYHTARNGPGDRARALALGEEAVKILPKSSPVYAQALNNLVVYYSLSGDRVMAQKYANAALKSMKKLEQTTVNYASLLSNQAVRLANAGNYEQASEYAREALGIFAANGDTTSLNYARLLSNTASFEKHAERYMEAIPLWQKAAVIFERFETKNGSSYLDCMSEISSAYAKTGNLEQSADINERLQATADEQARKGDSRYAHSLTKRASITATDGNYQQAVTLVQQALPIFRIRRDVADEASALNELSNYLYHVGRIGEAIDTCRHALRLYQDIPNREEDLALALNNLSIYHFANRAFADALATSREAVEAYEKTGNTETSYFAKILTNQALYEACQDSLRAAIAISLRARGIQRRALGDIHPDNVMLTYNLANYYVRMGDSLQAQRLFHEALDMQMQHVRSNFSHLTTRGRELYWGTKSYIFRAAPYMACLMENCDSVLIDAYDAQLFTKGLLLNSEVDFRNLLARTASPAIQDKYAQLEAIHQQVELAWRKPSEQSRAQIPYLTAKANRLERELMRDCKEFGDFTEAMSISWKQVNASLMTEEAAIEFFDIDTHTDGRSYWALVTRPLWRAPRLVRLFRESELNALRFEGRTFAEALTVREGIHALFEDSRVGQLVWGSLIPLLDGVRHIYFSPSGLLYQLGIEYLPYGQQRINDRFALHRVSSTKLLAQRTADRRSLAEIARKTVIFGGLDYDATVDELLAANQERKAAPVDYLASFTAGDKADLAQAETRTMDSFLRDGRGSVGYLKGTRLESDLIAECLFMHNLEPEIYLGADGTEEAFKEMSGRDISLLHVATHGFALSEASVRKNSQTMDYLDTAEDNSAQADNSLCYSGLLLAGANNVLSGRPLPEGMENGVLTAREIACLDLRGLQLAVLSACQTGLGELREDGVFGLQRGFKKAGAHTLLMSLWSVDDEATQTMMTHFYEALTQGQTRRQAFHTAQNALRSHPRFSSPFFWASFVMLDD